MSDPDESAPLTFRLLGDLEVRRRGAAVPLIEQPKPRRFLAALLFDAPRAVPLATLDERVWDEPVAQQLRQKYLGVLRRNLAPDGELLERRNGGYRMNVPADRIDVNRFHNALRSGYAAIGRDDDAAVAHLRAALGLWAGEPLAGLGDGWAERCRLHLRHQRREAELKLYRLLLRRGPDAELLAALEHLHRDQPGSVEAVELYMLALAEAGDPGHAHEVYRAVRAAALRRGEPLDERLTALDRRLQRAPAGVPVPPAVSRAPRLLPAPLPGFVGRDAELAEMEHLGAGGRVIVLDGPPGVGKTALALHFAHRVAPRFPDGALFLDLRGFDPSDEPLTVPRALRHLLIGLGVDAREIEQDEADRINQFRGAAHGRRLVIVLDNAADAQQVRALVPNPESLVVVTSRRKLPGLGVRPGAAFVALGLPDAAEAAQVLRSHLAGAGVAADPAALDRIVRSCGRLPLALAIVGAQAASRPERPIGELIRDLDSGGVFDTGDEATSLWPVLRWSYGRLTTRDQATFRLLGLHPGPELQVDAVAALTGTDPAEARRSLTQLADVRLVESQPQDRYALHDLIREYAGMLVHEAKSDDWSPALRRLHDYYLHSADRCAARLREHRQPLRLPDPAPGVDPVTVGTEAEAMAWLTAEHEVLARLIRRAGDNGLAAYSWMVLRTMTDYLEWRGLWDDWIELSATAVHTCELNGDETGHARARRSLGRALTQVARYADAEVHLRAVLDFYRSTGDTDGQARLHHDLADLLGRQNRHRDALTEVREAHRLAVADGAVRELGNTLDGIAWCHLQLHEYDEAVERCREAIDRHRANGYARGEAAAQDTLGEALSKLGRHAEALAALTTALTLCRRAGDRFNEAMVLDHLGDCRHRAGDTTARAAWSEAVTVLRALGRDAAADRIAAKSA